MIQSEFSLSGYHSLSWISVAETASSPPSSSCTRQHRHSCTVLTTDWFLLSNERSKRARAKLGKTSTEQGGSHHQRGGGKGPTKSHSFKSRVEGAGGKRYIYYLALKPKLLRIRHHFGINSLYLIRNVILCTVFNNKDLTVFLKLPPLLSSKLGFKTRFSEVKMN